MSENNGFRRLRSYLMAYFIPLTGVPLLLMAAVSYFLLSQAVNREILKRSGPEISAMSRNLDTMERRIERSLSDLSRKTQFQTAMLQGSPEAISAELRSFLSNAPFERVRSYSLDGQLLADIRAKDSKKLNEQWSKFFGPRTQESIKEKAALFESESINERLPAAQGDSIPDFASPKKRILTDVNGRLAPDFLKHLRNEDYFGVRELNMDGSVFDPRKPSMDLVQYKLILDSVYRPLGITEARLSLDQDKLRILADYQGVELFILDSGFRLVSASHSDIERQVLGATDRWRDMFSKSTLGVIESHELRVKKDPVEFFFTPIETELSGQSETAGLLAVGLNKRDQIQLRNRVIFWISILALGLAGAVVLITIRLSDRITQPVSDLVRATEMMKQGEWVHPVDSNQKTEIGVLVKRFNEMAQSVQVTKRTLELKLEELAFAHDELTKTQGHLVQSAKMSSLGQLVAGVAHELNNPIAFIYSNMTQMKSYLRNLEKLNQIVISILQKSSEKDASELKSALENIEWDYVRNDMNEMVQSCLDGSIRVKDIVLGLRNFSRLDKGEIGDIDAHSMLENTVKLLNSQIKNRIEIHWDLCPSGRMRANASQLNQVFMNILANGLQSIEGKGNVWIKTWTSFVNEEEIMNFSIRDSGKGIKQEHIDKIFDPFFTTKKVGEGTGLGLSIVYGIIERHRGVVQVKSRLAPDPAHGTEFIIQFPRWGFVQESQKVG